MGIGVMPMVVVVVVTVISMRMRRMPATQRDWHTIGLTGTSALELTQIAAIGQSLNMVMVAGLGKAHFRLKTQHLCSVFTERAIHRCLTTEHFIHPLHKGVLDPDVVSEIGSMQKFHLRVIVSDAFTVLTNSGDENTREQKIGEHDDALKPKAHHMPQPWLHQREGHTGIHGFAPAEAKAFHQHPRNLCHVGIGIGIR